MAVPEGKRTESKMAFQTKAIELAKYTTTICNNNNIFPKRDRWMVANRIVSASIDIMTNVAKANSVYVSKREDYEERAAYQRKARDATIEMLSLLDLAYSKYDIGSRRMAHWTGLIYEERNLILSWIKSEKTRFKNL